MGSATVALGVAMLSAFSAGCEGPVPPHAARLLVESQQAYVVGDDAAVIERTDRFLREFPKAQEAAEAHYLRGLARRRQGDLEAAEGEFNEAIRGTQRGDLAGRAEMALGEMAEGRGDDEAAVKYYRQALTALGETDPPADEVLFRLGCALQRQGQWRQADLQFDRLLYRFPDSAHGEQVALRIRARAWTIQVGAFDQRHNAEQLRRQCAAAGLAAQIAPVQAPRAMLAVQVGRFATYAAAAAQLDAARRVAEAAALTTVR